MMMDVVETVYRYNFLLILQSSNDKQMAPFFLLLKKSESLDFPPHPTTESIVLILV